LYAVYRLRPDRRSFLKLAHDIGWCVGRFQADQKMYVVFNATDSLGHTAQSTHRAAEVFVESRAPIRTDK